MIFVDANVPLYAVGGAHPLKAPCQRVLLAAGATENTFVTSAEVLQEVLHVLRRHGDWKAAAPAFYDFAETMATAILPIDGTDIIQAADYVKGSGPRIETRDLVHLATMRRHGIERVATADRAFDTFSGIRRLDPAKLDEWADPDWFDGLAL